MINKLRRQIILINMILVGVLLLGVFTTLCVNSYRNSLEQLERGVTHVLEINTGGHNRFEPGAQGDSPSPADSDDADDDDDDEKSDDDDSFEEDDDNAPVRIGDRKIKEDFSIEVSSYVMVTAYKTGVIINTQENNATIDSETLNAAVSDILASKQQSGTLPQYGLIYGIRDEMDRVKIIIADSSSITSALRNAIILNSILFLASMVVVFLISLWLSGIAVKPVKDAWVKQKQFVADASHELKTPLTVILANNNIIMKHGNSKVSDERQWLESTEEEAQHMKQLINQMLFLAKSDAGSTNVEFSDVNFSDIVEGAALNFEPVAFEKSIMIDADIAENLTLHGNATQLNQLVHILTDNAVKYADEGTTVTIRLQKKGDQTELSVNNFGTVIEKDDLAHIFDRFYRAEKSRTTKGYGLGLSIAQNIVESMNGRLTAASSKAEGTTFTATFK